jgi:hypothetical protein
VLGDDLDVEVEVGCCLGSPRVSKNDMFDALCGLCERWFLGLEGAARESLLPSFDFRFLFGLGRHRRLRGSHPIAVGRQSNGTASMEQTFLLRC